MFDRPALFKIPNYEDIKQMISEVYKHFRESDTHF